MPFVLTESMVRVGRSMMRVNRSKADELLAVVETSYRQMVYGVRGRVTCQERGLCKRGRRCVKLTELGGDGFGPEKEAKIERFQRSTGKFCTSTRANSSWNFTTNTTTVGSRTRKEVVTESVDEKSSASRSRRRASLYGIVRGQVGEGLSSK